MRRETSAQKWGGTKSRSKGNPGSKILTPDGGTPYSGGISIALGGSAGCHPKEGGGDREERKEHEFTKKGHQDSDMKGLSKKKKTG